MQCRALFLERAKVEGGQALKLHRSGSLTLAPGSFAAGYRSRAALEGNCCRNLRQPVLLVLSDGPTFLRRYCHPRLFTVWHQLMAELVAVLFMTTDPRLLLGWKMTQCNQNGRNGENGLLRPSSFASDPGTMNECPCPIFERLSRWTMVWPTKSWRDHCRGFQGTSQSAE